MKIVWSQRSITHLENISAYISKDSEYHANKFVEKLINATENLETFPKIGRVVPKFKNKNIREIFVKSYRIIYRIDPDKIYILTVLHGSRDITKDENNPIK